MHGYLEQVTSGKLELRIASEDLHRLEAQSRRSPRLAISLTAGATLALCAALLQVFDSSTARWHGLSLIALGAAALAVWAFVRALRTR